MNFWKKNKNIEIKEEIENTDLQSISTMTSGNKTRQLYKFNYNNKIIYIIASSTYIFYAFVILPYFDEKNGYKFRTEANTDISVVSIYDDNKENSVIKAYNLDNYKDIGKILDKKDYILKTIEDNLLAVIIMSATLEKFDDIKSISLSNYKNVETGQI